jgi:hypothetical protein
LPRLSYAPYRLRQSEESCDRGSQMASEFDKLEEAIMADMWNAYTKAVIDHALNPGNFGSMTDVDGFGRVTGLRKGAMGKGLSET